MRPDVCVRRRDAASTCFATGAADEDEPSAVAGDFVPGADDGVTGVEGFGGSDLATTLSLVLGAVVFTGVTGFGGVVELAAAVVTASAFGGWLDLVGVADAGDGCAATAFGAVDCGIAGCGLAVFAGLVFAGVVFAEVGFAEAVAGCVAFGCVAFGCVA